MKAVLLAGSVAALVSVAACNRAEEPAGETAATPAPATVETAQVQDIDQEAPVLKVEEAYGVRHERFEEIGDALQLINRELKGGSPDVEAIRTRATRVAELAPQVVGWFPPGSGADNYPKSRTKAELFQDQAALRDAAKQFVEASRAFELAAQSGNVESIRAAMPALGASCKNCHDKFRAPER